VIVENTEFEPAADILGDPAGFPPAPPAPIVIG
jgi:hypothetical protein